MKELRILPIIYISFLLLTAISCGKIEDLDTSFDPNVIISPTYSSISQYVLKPACIKCHGNSESSGGYSFDTYLGTMRAVNSGSPNSSPLFISVRTGSMPQGGQPSLSNQQLQAVYDWISNGSPNN
jgi:mono/diheme cytochrome c family protein